MIPAPIVERFGLRDSRHRTEPVGGHTHVVFAETVDGVAVVVKTSADRERIAAEAEALRAFGVRRAVAVRDIWLEGGAILLERVEPGRPLASEATEEEATAVVAGLLGETWPPVPPASRAEPVAAFVTALDRVVAAHSSVSGSLDHRLLQRASAMLAELVSDAVGPVLLHGDLHYGNILTSERAGHLLIDPKGMIGEPAFDIGYLVSRPQPAARDARPLKESIGRRLEILPDATGLDRRRVAAYAFVAAALSAVWALEDGEPAGEYGEAMRLLETFAG